jgi:hypothetical protein
MWWNRGVTAHLQQKKNNTFLFISDDDSTLYFNAYENGGQEAAFCWLELSGVDYQWHTFQDIRHLTFVLYLGSDTFIVSGKSKVSNNFKMMKFSFNNVAPIWNKELSWPDDDWDAEFSTAVLSSDGSKIYFMISKGDTGNLFFFTIQSSNGEIVNSIHKSNLSCQGYDLIQTNGAIYGVAQCSTNSFVLKYNSENDSFGTFYLSTGSLFQIYASKNDRIFGFGSLSDSWWIPSFFYDQIVQHPDFGEDTIGLSLSTISNYNNADAEDGLSALVTNTFTVDDSPSSSSVTYIESTNWVDTIVYYSDPETIRIKERVDFEFSLSVTWSTAGESVTHVLSSYNGNSIPEWVSINSSTGALFGTSPSVVSDSSYQFAVSTTSPEFNGIIQKVITITVIRVEESNYAKIATTSTVIMNSLGISTSVGILVISGSSPAGIWAIINQIQILLLIITIDDHIPRDIEYYLRENILAMFDLSFIPLIDIPYFNYLAKYLDGEQENRVAKKMMFDSRSTFTNYFVPFIFLLWITMVSLLLKLIKNWRDEQSSKTGGKLINMAYYLTVYVLIFRILLKIYLGVAVSGFAELGQASNNSANTVVSLNFTMLFLAGCLTLLWVSLYFWYKYRSKSLPENFILIELFRGLKEWKFAKFNSALFLLRRLIFTLLIVFSFIPRNALYPILLVLQLAYFAQLVMIKPYEDIGNTVVEIITEAFILISIVIFHALNSPERWEGGGTSTYLTLIILNSLFILIALWSKSFTLTYIVNFILKAIKVLKTKYSKKMIKVRPVEENAKVRVQTPRPLLSIENTTAKESIKLNLTLFHTVDAIKRPSPLES